MTTNEELEQDVDMLCSFKPVLEFYRNVLVLALADNNLLKRCFLFVNLCYTCQLNVSILNH